MTCREVEHVWGLRLDEVRAGASAGASEGFPAELEDHLARCPRCRAKVAAFSTLARAVTRLEAPTAPAGLSARVLAAVEADRGRVSVPLRSSRRAVMVPIVRRLSVAAAVLVVLFGLRAWRLSRVDEVVPPLAVGPVVAVEAPPRPLTETVAEVAEVTVAIARRTSEPAARLGREVLGAASSPPGNPIDPAPIEVVEGAADRVVKVLGSRLEAGVRPLSEPTRSAFSFLLPSLPPAEEPSTPERGA